MNSRVLLYIAGFALMTAGTFMFEIGAQKYLRGDEVLAIPEGTANYTYVEIDMPGGGPVSGTFESLSGGDVMIMVLDGGQFDRFMQGEDHGSRYAGTGTSGDFSIEQVDMERCSIVLFHGGGGSAVQEVRVTYKVVTIDSGRAFVGAGMMAGGIALLAIGMVQHMRKLKAARPPPKYLDVVFFDERTK
jgi:hypothetical protein